MRRPLRESDFKEYGIFGDMIHAIYTGNSKYLIQGEEYMVTKSNRKNKVTVQLSYNKKLKTSNGGVEFSINTFEIEVEDENKMVSLAELSPEEREHLLSQARDLIEQENIEKNAIVMYRIKKKEYFENLMNEIANELNIKKENEKTYLISKIKTLVYTLYRYDKYKGKREFNENNTISCAKEWESFIRIGNTIKDAVIKSVKGDKS